MATIGPAFPTAQAAGVAQLVEHDVANVVVVGSNPITRSPQYFLEQAKLSEYRKICLPARILGPSQTFWVQKDLFSLIGVTGEM
jgi:hypothetical protein